MRLIREWRWAVLLFWAAIAIAPSAAALGPSPADLIASAAGRFVLRELGIPVRVAARGAGERGAGERAVARILERINRELAASEDPLIRSLLARDGAAIRAGEAVEERLRATVIRAIAEGEEWRTSFGTTREAFLAGDAESGLWPAVTEGYHEVPILARRADVHGGYIYSLHHSRTMRFETGTTRLTYEAHPEAIEHLGFRVYTDAEGRVIEEFPGPTAFTKRLEVLRGLAPDLIAETHIRLTDFPGGIPPQDYLGILSTAGVPVARKALWFRHDILVHGYALAVLMPAEVWSAYRAELEAILGIARIARQSGDTRLGAVARALLAERAAATDQVTARLNTGMFEGGGQFDRPRHLSGSWDNLVLGPERLRARIDELLAGHALSPEVRANLDESLGYAAPDANRRRALAERLLEFLGIPARVESRLPAASRR